MKIVLEVIGLYLLAKQTEMELILFFWGIFAIFGFLCVGFLFGAYSMKVLYEEKAKQQKTEESQTFN